MKAPFQNCRFRQRMQTFEMPKNLWYSNDIFNFGKMQIISETVEKGIIEQSFLKSTMIIFFSL